MSKVVHFEIPADDVGRAQEFYQQVFQWYVVPMPEMEYAIFHTGPTNKEDGMVQEKGFINGGMMKRGDQLKSPVVTIDVPSIEEALEQIKAHGGSLVIGKQQVGDMGFSAYFKDSEGNVLGLWENARKH